MSRNRLNWCLIHDFRVSFEYEAIENHGGREGMMHRVNLTPDLRGRFEVFWKYVWGDVPQHRRQDYSVAMMRLAHTNQESQIAERDNRREMLFTTTSAFKQSCALCGVSG